jgi:hypothetical protein
MPATAAEKPAMGDSAADEINANRTGGIGPEFGKLQTGLADLECEICLVAIWQAKLFRP